MNLDKFIFAEPAGRDRLYILTTSYPYHVGQVVKSTEPIENRKDRQISKCPGYKVYIMHVGVLAEDAVYDTPEERERIMAELQEKAMFYFDERIHQSPGRFKRYLD